MCINSLKKPCGDPDISIIRMVTVISITGLSRTTLWRRVKDGSFPEPVQISANAIGWYAHEIEKFLLSLPRTNTKDRS